ALANRDGSPRTALEILSTHHVDSFEERAERLAFVAIEVSLDPRLKRRNLALDNLDRRGLLLGVAPVDVERRLDARPKKQTGARPAADVLLGNVENLRHDADYRTCCMAEKVDRVLYPPGPYERAAIDRDAQRFGERLRFALLRNAVSNQHHRSFEEHSVHLVLDESLSKRLQRALREWWLRRTKTTKYHLPAEVHDRQLDRFGIRRTHIALEQDDH